MKPEDYNPKAREAFAKSLIDVGVGIFKSIMALIVIAPITFIFRATLEGKNDLPTFNGISPDPLFNIFIVLVIIGFALGYYFRREGLRHLHELENNA